MAHPGPEPLVRKGSQSWIYTLWSWSFGGTILILKFWLLSFVKMPEALASVDHSAWHPWEVASPWEWWELT